MNATLELDWIKSGIHAPDERHIEAEYDKKWSS